MKKNFSRINLRILRNEEWFNLMTEFKGFVEQFLPEFPGVESVFVEFKNLLVKADTALEQIRKSALTDVISSLDGQRDNAFRALKSLWKAALFNPEHEKRDAALDIEPVFKHYGNIPAKLYNEETSAIINFIQELREQHATQLATLGLDALLSELEAANNRFETTVLLRNTELSSKPDLKMLEVRRETDSCYMSIIERIEAKILLDDKETEFEPFIKTVNTNIERYKRNRPKSGNKEN